MKKFLIPMALLLASCAPAPSPSIPSSSILPSESSTLDDAPLQSFFQKAATNQGRIQTFLEDRGEFQDYITFDFYGPRCAYQTNGEYLQNVYQSYGETLEDQGVLVYGDQGLFSFHFGDEGSFLLGDPLGVGTSLSEAGIHLLEELADPSIYVSGKDSLSYASKLEKNVPVAAKKWFAVMGVELEGSATVTKAAFTLAPDGGSATAMFTILEQESGKPVTSRIKAEISSLGSLSPKGGLQEALEHPTPLPVPTEFGEVAKKYLSNVPGQENTLPFPEISTVQYVETVKYNTLQISVDGVNIAASYIEQLKKAGFVMKRDFSSGVKTYYVHEATGSEESSFLTSSLQVSLSYLDGCSYITVSSTVKYKGVEPFNAFVASWNEGIYNVPESQGGYDLGCFLPIFPSSASIAGMEFQDETEYLNDYYLAAGVNPYLLLALSGRISIGSESDAGAYLSSLVEKLEEIGYVDLGEKSFANDHEAAYLLSPAGGQFGIGIHLQPVYEENAYTGVVAMRIYCSVPDYVKIFLNQ
ncbi:MAG: hypothetical protein SOV58_03125 [Candidatus Enteromonas sp.]|nr:hypothetical protein [Candidatus Enteromonas sp.]